MYCSECKLRVADDSVTVCPVCQGPLQSDTENEAVPAGDGVVGKSGPGDIELQVGDKISAYEKTKQELYFNPEELGLQSLDTDADVENDDITALADLWGDEDIDAELEGVLAEAFSLDQLDEDLEVEEEFDLEGKGLEFDNLERASSSSSSSAANEIAPVLAPVVPAPRNNRSFLLLLLFVVIAAGGVSWFYLQSLGVKSDDPTAAKPVAQVEAVRSTPAPVLKDGVDKKVKVAEPVAAPAPAIADDKSIKLKVTLPVRVSAPSEVAEIDEEKAIVSPSATSTKFVATPDAQPLSNVQKLSDLTQTQRASSVKSEKLVEAAESVGEKSPDPIKAATKEVVNSADKVKTPLLMRDGGDAVKGGEGKPVKEAPLASAQALPALVYVVHVGSFKSNQRALNQVARLQKKGFAAYMVKVDLQGKGVWQRVMIPGGATREEAKVVQEKLAELFPREESLIKRIKK